MIKSRNQNQTLSKLLNSLCAFVKQKIQAHCNRVFNFPYLVNMKRGTITCKRLIVLDIDAYLIVTSLN